MRKVKSSENSIITKDFSLIIILFLTLLVYLRVFMNDMTSRDDETYVLLNPSIKALTFHNIRSYFTEFVLGNYQPLSLLCYSLGHFIGGTNPWPYQLINIGLHIANTSLVYFLVVKILRQSGSTFKFSTQVAFCTSLLFGIHTLHVESVAWIAENKNVLYSFFFLISLNLYLNYIKSSKKYFYFFSLLLFILSLLSKGMAVSLPLTLLAIDYFLRRNLCSGRVILEKVPFFLLSLLFGIIAIKAQGEGINSIQHISHFTLAERISFAGYGFIQYLLKLVLPINLSNFYEYPYKTAGPFPIYYYIYLLAALILLSILIVKLHTYRFLIFGFMIFLFNLIFVLQLIPVGDSIMADRYCYIPSIGIFFILGHLFITFIQGQSVYKYSIYGLIIIYMIALYLLTFQRIGVWRDNLTLYTDMLKKSNFEKFSRAWIMRASTYNRMGLYQEALDDINKCIPYHRNDADAFFIRGVAKHNLGYTDEAFEDYNRSIALGTKLAEAYNNRAIIKMQSEDFFEALNDFNQALILNKSFIGAFLGRADVKIRLNDFRGAVQDLDSAIILDPYRAEVFNNRGRLKKELNDFQGALNDFNRAIVLRKDFIIAYQNRIDVEFKLADYKSAIEDLNLLISFQADPTAYYFRGYAKILSGNDNEGCNDLQRAVQLGYSVPDSLISSYCNSFKNQ